MKLTSSQIIGQGQLRVEAALEQDPAAAVVFEFHELGGEVVPIQDVAVAGPGRPVKGAEAAARGADVGVVDIPVDDEGDPVAGIEAAAHLIGRGPQGQEVQVPELPGFITIQTLAENHPLTSMVLTVTNPKGLTPGDEKSPLPQQCPVRKL